MGEQMTIDRNSWHARLYCWWYTRKHHGDFPTTANLCPYVRVVLLWCWLRWLLVDGRIWRVRVPLLVWGFALARLPFWAGMFDYGAKLLLFILYFWAVVLGAVAFIADRIEERRKRLGYVAKESTFRRVLTERAKAMHQGICPVVEIR
jgi:hypothetical protein